MHSFGRVGHGFASKTENPTFYTSEEGDITYCDFPGFHNTRGPEKDAKTLHDIQALGGQNGAKAIVVVLSWAGFDIFNASFNEVISKLYDTFPNLADNKEKIMSSIFFAFTKTNHTVEDVPEKLTNHKKRAEINLEQALQEKKEEKSKRLRKELSVHEYIMQENYQDHFLFPNPIDQGETREAILQKIKQAEPIPKDSFRPIASEK